jgi:2-oxoglutarate ferredoxin oxidoreductase subunit alpha
MMNNRVLISGNEAVAQAAVRAGCRFFAGYPICPSTEIMENLAKLLPEVGGVFIQMEDEISSIAAVLGASLAGKKAMTATSGPGFSLMQENLGFGYMAEIPCVVVDSQRVGPSTGLPTKPAQGDIMQSAWGTHGDHPVIVFYPSTVEEVYHETIRAFNWSERLRTPVILLLDEFISHMRESVVIPSEVEIWERKKPDAPPEECRAYKAGEDDVPAIPDFGDGYRFHVTGLHHDETGFPSTKPHIVMETLRRLKRKVERVEKELEKNEFYMVEDAEIVVISFGSLARTVKRAVRLAREEGVRVGMMKIITLWPSPSFTLRKIAEGKKALIVAEMNMGQYVLEVERIVKDLVPVIPLNTVTGTLMHPLLIFKKIKEVSVS